MDVIKFLVQIQVWHAFFVPLFQTFLLTLQTCLKHSPFRHPILSHPPWLSSTLSCLTSLFLPPPLLPLPLPSPCYHLQVFPRAGHVRDINQERVQLQ